jgi:predicted RNase H-like nuclease (RuvC/YqgF family)
MQAAIDSEETYAEYNAYWPAHYASEEYIAYAEATEALDAISTEIEALRDAYAADDDYEYHVNFLAEQIEAWEAKIETANAAIEALEATCELGKEGSELFLAELQKGIDMLELKVAAAQKEVDEAKAKLDAALAE